MNSERTLYKSLSKFVFTDGVPLHDLRAAVTFIWCLVGLLLSGKIHLSQWALHRPGKAKANGKERQIARWLHKEEIVPKQVYRNLCTAALLHWDVRSALKLR
jgi:hypothetical protein